MFKIRGSIIENMYLMNLHSELPYRIIVTMWPKGLKLMTLDEDLSTAIHLKSSRQQPNTGGFTVICYIYLGFPSLNKFSSLDIAENC